VNSSAKLRTYRKFKSDFCFENYLICLRETERVAVTKLRTSSHRLEIERGRHQFPVVPVGNRICRSCSDNAIGDEFHAVMNCQTFTSTRQIVFDTLCDFTFFNDLNDDLKFIFVMSLGKNDSEVAVIVSHLFFRYN